MTQPARFSLSLNGEFWLALVLVIFTTISIRLAELPYWQDGAFFVDGEHLMATHDAYAWLAGVKGVGVYVGHPFSRLLAFINDLGMNVATLGFWSPILFVPLLALPICLLARTLRLTEGSLVFGILATSGLGYLVRTRLGFCDTDVLTLLFPVSVSSCLIIWMGSLMRQGWARTAIASSADFSPVNAMMLALGVGVLGKIGVIFYSSSMSIILATYFMAGLVGLVLVRKNTWDFFGAGLVLMFAVTFGGWVGSLLAGVWALWCLRKPLNVAVKYQVLGFIGVAIAVLVLADTHEMVWVLVQRVFFYAKTSSPDFANSTTAALKLPDIAQSVREAQNLDWGLIGARMGGNWVVFSLGLFGFGFVTWRRPALLVFLPFLILGLASVRLGNRFAMYGTVGIGMGLGLGLSELMSMLRQSQGRRWIAQLALACLALWPSADLMQEMMPVPVLPQTYAQTFLDLRDSTEPDALLWQWWDYGYAGQYYAERATFGDGGRQSGPWLYPLARVHCATTSRQAIQMMRYFGQVTLENGLSNTADTRTALFQGNPMAEIQKMDAVAAKQFLVDLTEADQIQPSTVPNYLVLSWENLRLASWISYYGNWDIVSGTSSPGKMQQVQGEIRVDSATGSLVVNGKPMNLDSLDVVEEGGTRHFDWPNGSGSHVLINQLSRQVFLMDAKMYRSMMVQMLIRPPQDFADDFTLVVEKYPWARAYKVKE